MLTHQILVLLLIGYIVYTIDLKKKYFPVPVVLVLIGLGLSFVPAFSAVSLSKDTIFEVFLPALLFVGAYQFPLKKLKQNLGIIAALSTLGLLATAILLGFSIYWASNFFMPLSLAGAFLLAAILIPTDPVSVTSILKDSSGADGIAEVVEGESMVNDGTSIVLFTIFLAMYETGNSFSAGTFLVEFLTVSLGGIASGLLFGWVLSKIIHITHHRQYQVMLSIITAYGGFYLAEASGVSGVLATVVTGIILSYEIDKTAEEHAIEESLNGFWGIVTPTLLSVLFLLIGIRTAEYLSLAEWGFAAIIFFLTLFARFLMLSGFIYAIPAWRDEFKNDFKTISLITWSGIKGSMSIALVLWLEEGGTGQEALIVSLSFAVILMSLVFQSIGIYPLAKLLKNN